jgi:LysM repeat protein
MRIKLALLVAIALSGKNIYAQKTEDILTYINNYRELAVSEMQRSGIPASIILAQGIHETEAGTSELVRKSNNHFGIKCKDTWTGSVVYHDDDERGECFRSYNNPQDSYKDHSDFLHNSPRYAFLFKIDPTDYQSWAYGLKKAGYATNIRYSQILIKLIEDYNLQQYTLIALGKLDQPSDMISTRSRTNSEIAARSFPSQTEINLPPAPRYPPGKFEINRTDVTFAKAGTAWISIAEQYDLPLSRLLDFNDVETAEVLPKDQLVYLQRKRKVGANEFHIVQKGESLYDICQTEAIRIESLLELNQLDKGMEVASGEKLFLISSAPSRPLLTPAVSARLENARQNDPPPEKSIIHIVETKETLYSIARKYGVEVEKIRVWNNLESLSVKRGQELVIHKN